MEVYSCQFYTINNKVKKSISINVTVSHNQNAILLPPADSPAEIATEAKEEYNAQSISVQIQNPAASADAPQRADHQQTEGHRQQEPEALVNIDESSSDKKVSKPFKGAGILRKGSNVRSKAISFERNLVVSSGRSHRLTLYQEICVWSCRLLSSNHLYEPNLYIIIIILLCTRLFLLIFFFTRKRNEMNINERIALFWRASDRAKILLVWIMEIFCFTGDEVWFFFLTRLPEVCFVGKQCVRERWWLVSHGNGFAFCLNSLLLLIDLTLESAVSNKFCSIRLVEYMEIIVCVILVQLFMCWNDLRVTAYTTKGIILVNKRIIKLSF